MIRNAYNILLLILANLMIYLNNYFNYSNSLLKEL